MSQVNSRRSFLLGMAGILAVGVAPAIVKAANIMPVRASLPPEFAWEWVEKDGVLTATFKVIITELSEALNVPEQMLIEAKHVDGGIIRIAR